MEIYIILYYNNFLSLLTYQSVIACFCFISRAVRKVVEESQHPKQNNENNAE